MSELHDQQTNSARTNIDTCIYFCHWYNLINTSCFVRERWLDVDSTVLLLISHLTQNWVFSSNLTCCFLLFSKLHLLLSYFCLKQSELRLYRLFWIINYYLLICRFSLFSVFAQSDMWAQTSEQRLDAGLPRVKLRVFLKEHMRGDWVKLPLSLSLLAVHCLPTPSCVCLLWISRQQESTCSLNITHITP